MPSALFRTEPRFSYTPIEQLQRCAIADLRVRLTEPLVSTGIPREQVLEIQQDEQAFRVLIAERLGDERILAPLRELFAESGELGDIGKITLYRYDPALAGRLDSLGDDGELTRSLGSYRLRLERDLRGPSTGTWRWMDLRVVGTVRTSLTETATAAAEIRIYRPEGYWVLAYREHEDVAARAVEFMREVLSAPLSDRPEPHPRGLSSPPASKPRERARGGGEDEEQ